MHEERVGNRVPGAPDIVVGVTLRRLRSTTIPFSQLLPLAKENRILFVEYQGGWWFVPPELLHDAIRVKSILTSFESYLPEGGKTAPWPVVSIDGSLERLIPAHPRIVECLSYGRSKHPDDIPYLGDGQADTDAEPD